jgi:hypothetical protein
MAHWGLERQIKQIKGNKYPSEPTYSSHISSCLIFISIVEGRRDTCLPIEICAIVVQIRTDERTTFERRVSLE